MGSGVIILPAGAASVPGQRGARSIRLVRPWSRPRERRPARL